MGRQRFRLTNTEPGKGRITGWDDAGDDRPFQERVNTLTSNVVAMAFAEGFLTTEDPSLTLVCDGCGAAAIVNAEDPELPSGWVAGERGDFCRACA